MQVNKKWFRAAASGDIGNVERLLNNDANVNAQDNNGSTALHWVSANGHANLAKLLIEHQADVNILNNRKISPLEWAANNHYVALVQHLISGGAEFNMETDSEGMNLYKVQGRDINAATMNEVKRYLEEKSARK